MKMNNETKVGIMVAGVLVMLIGLTVKSGDFKFRQEGYLVKVQFENIDGVDLNAPVMLNGFEVGHVKDIDIVDDGTTTMMELSVWLKQEAMLRDGARAYVKNMGFLGEKYVGLTAGDSGGDYLTEGALIVGESPADLDALLLDGQEIANQIKEISTNINQRLKKNKEHIDEILAGLDLTVKNLVSITDNVDERLKVNEHKIDSIMASLESAVVNLDQFTYDLKIHPWKLLYRPKVKREKSIKMLKEQDAR